MPFGHACISLVYYKRRGAALRHKGQNEDADVVFVSVASFWEMAVKESLGKLELPNEVDAIMDECQSHGIGILPVKGTHLAKLKKLPFIHRDPFDRLLICQADAEDMTLVTADEQIIRYNIATLWK